MIVLLVVIFGLGSLMLGMIWLEMYVVPGYRVPSAHGSNPEGPA